MLRPDNDGCRHLMLCRDIYNYSAVEEPDKEALIALDTKARRSSFFFLFFFDIRRPVGQLLSHPMYWVI